MYTKLHQPLSKIALTFLVALSFHTTTYASAETAAQSGYEADRKAILAMVGEYQVSFKFIETVPLSKDYQRKPDKLSGALEKVYLVEDSPKKIVLQHLLVSSDGQVTKHWRQDWFYEATQRVEFTQDQTWQLKDIAKDKISQHWTQCVYEVTDAPRYCGTAKWNHHYGNPTWTSDRTWRPLPRREYTTRNDYNALNVENRHTITPNGWTHEQDNTKTIRNGTKTAGVITREFGFNEYTKTNTVNFKPADEYWAKTQIFWSGIRQRWQNLTNQGCVSLKFGLNDTTFMQALFHQAESGKADQHQTDQLYQKWVGDCK